jgi:hypothetical protein
MEGERRMLVARTARRKCGQEVSVMQDEEALEIYKTEPCTLCIILYGAVGNLLRRQMPR